MTVHLHMREGNLLKPTKMCSFKNRLWCMCVISNQGTKGETQVWEKQERIKENIFAPVLNLFLHDSCCVSHSAEIQTQDTAVVVSLDSLFSICSLYTQLFHWCNIFVLISLSLSAFPFNLWGNFYVCGRFSTLSFYHCLEKVCPHTTATISVFKGAYFCRF